VSETLGERISALVTAPGTKDLVSAFYDPGGTFAGALFDTLGANPLKRFSGDDLLAVSLLDMGFKPRAVRGLLESDSAREIGSLLRAVPSTVTIWEASDDVLMKATRLWAKIRSLNEQRVLTGVGPTKTSKLLARKRPHLIPIVDSVIRAAMDPLFGENEWLSLREALRDAGLRREIHDLRPSGAEQASTLRLLDSAIWMWCSQSRDAKRARTGMAHPLGRSAT
jgi:hypothetical protein